jgi:hypothetical protein
MKQSVSFHEPREGNGGREEERGEEGGRGREGEAEREGERRVRTSQIGNRVHGGPTQGCGVTPQEGGRVGRLHSGRRKDEAAQGEG